MKVETLRHTEAYDYYYSLGEKRSYPKVALKFTVSRTSIKKWAKNFNWQKRVEQRDIENAKSIEKKTNKIIVNSKADYRAEIKTQLGILKAILNKVIKDIKKEKIIDINNIDDLKDVISSYEKLCKLDLNLMGKAIDNEAIKIVFEIIDAKSPKNDKESDKKKLTELPKKEPDNNRNNNPSS